MMTDLIVMIGVECPLLPRVMGLTLIGSKMTGVNSVWDEELRSTLGNQALRRDPSSFKVWLTGTGLIGKARTEMRPPAAEYMLQDQNVSVEPSGPQ